MMCLTETHIDESIANEQIIPSMDNKFLGRTEIYTVVQS